MFLRVQYLDHFSSLYIFIYIYIYINDLHHATKYCKVNHFADDANLVYFSKSLKHLKHINNGLKYLVNWLNANKFYLNAKQKKKNNNNNNKKTKMDCFKSKNNFFVKL